MCLELCVGYYIKRREKKIHSRADISLKIQLLYTDEYNTGWYKSVRFLSSFFFFCQIIFHFELEMWKKGYTRKMRANE